MSSDTKYQRILDALRECTGQPMTVATLAEHTGYDGRTVSVAVSNSIRRRGLSPTSPWRHVRRVGHGRYVYDESDQQDVAPLAVSAPGVWVEVGSDGSVRVLRSPDGALYVASRLADHLHP